MPLPAPLSRGNPRSSKKDFGHLLIIAGSPSMLGAAALSSLAAMRSGAGLVTAAVPRDLNLTLQKKISNCVMTKPLAQSRSGAFSLKAYDQLKKIWDKFDAIAIGPGLGRQPATLQLARQVIIHCPKPLVIDADALFALAGHTQILLKAKAARVLTPHSGEMSRLTNLRPKEIEASRLKTARDFARRYNCVLLLKGHRSVVASPQGKTYINHTGNVGMATAGSGDVLTGMITAFLGQGMGAFDAAKYGAYYHGKAGDLAARARGKLGMIAEDIVDYIK
jgi:NAD(P)H-hydrate epimerase